MKPRIRVFTNGFDKMLEWEKQTGNDVFFESTIYKTKFTFMLDTTKAFLESDKKTDKKNEKDTRKADGAILVNGDVKAVIELKDHKTTDLKQVETQAFSYKNNRRKASYVVISNFEKLQFYIENTIDCEGFNLFILTKTLFPTSTMK